MKLKLFTLCLVLLFVCGQVFAASGKCGNHLKWKLDKNGVLTISGIGDMWNYNVNKKSTRPSWFNKSKSITSLIINEGVTSIGSHVFYYCDNLTSVTIPSSVRSIAIDAFYYCDGLSSIVVADGNTIYDSRDNCNAIIEKSSNRLIRGCKNTIIPSSVRSIGHHAFYHCCNLVFIKIPNNVVSIGDNAFGRCYSLTSVTIPNSVISIGDYAFYYCDNLTSVTIPNSVTRIGFWTFADCKNLLSIAIPNSVIIIQDRAFMNCERLTSVTIPNSVEHIGYQAFGDCYALAKVYYPKGMQFNNNIFSSKPKMIAYDKNSPSVNVPSQPPSLHPLLAIVDGSLDFNDANANNRIDAEEKCTLKFRVANNGKATATNCEARVKLSGTTSGIRTNTVKLPEIAVGQTCEVCIPITAKTNTENGKVTFSIEVYESNGWGIAPFDFSVATMALRSDIDKNIPSSQTQSYSTLVLVIANENYHSMPQVPYAINDGNIFKEYCVKTLGIPEENILYQPNATLNGIRQKIDLLQKKAQARNNAKKETHIIVYYTGHGVPDINTRGAYLMPTDGYEENISTGYKLDDLYQQLGNLSAKSITVFLDACFSGVNRNDEALAQNKGARLVAKSGMPVGNMVVFAASQGNQTAFVNDKEQHGLFTYYLLRKLQESKGDVTLDELANYLTSEVNLKSLDLHEKEQIPSIIASPQIQNQWQNWKLK